MAFIVRGDGIGPGHIPEDGPVDGAALLDQHRGFVEGWLSILLEMTSARAHKGAQNPAPKAQVNLWVKMATSCGKHTQPGGLFRGGEEGHLGPFPPDRRWWLFESGWMFYF